jgi:hypothetical protein
VTLVGAQWGRIIERMAKDSGFPPLLFFRAKLYRLLSAEAAKYPDLADLAKIEQTATAEVVGEEPGF